MNTSRRYSPEVRERAVRMVLELWDYSYNDVLNVEDITTTDGLTDYGYDGLDRLTTATYPLASPLTDETYEYDLVGNRELCWFNQSEKGGLIDRK